MFESSGAFLAGLDSGIRDIVRALREHGVETFESCEGGPGHCFPEPTVRFHGGDGAGWHALGVCGMLGLPAAELRRTWDIKHGMVLQVCWELVFQTKPYVISAALDEKGGA